MTNAQIKELSYELIKEVNDQVLLEKVERVGTHRQRIAICLNPNVSDDVLRAIAERKNPQLLDIIVLMHRLNAKDLFPYADISAAVAVEIQNYDDCTQEMLDYIDTNHLIR